MTKRKSFSAEFKRDAVRLLESPQKPPADLARELGVRRNQLYKEPSKLLISSPAFPQCSLALDYCWPVANAGYRSLFAKRLLDEVSKTPDN